MQCEYHLCTNELTGRQTKFCRNACKVKYYVRLNRHKMKERAVQYKGGACQCCGYNRCINVLSFHHRDPEHKDFGIAAAGETRSWERVKAEIDKCVLVCSNCHGEIHAGIREPPD